MATPSTEGSSVDYTDREIEEMKATFSKYDVDGSGHLTASEFSDALQDMDYKYSQPFIVEILRLVFDASWQHKQNHLVFEDFLNFMSEFEPIHYDVADKIAAKLQQHNSDSHEDEEEDAIIRLLQYVTFDQGNIDLQGIDEHLNADSKTAAPMATSATLPPEVALQQTLQSSHSQAQQQLPFTAMTTEQLIEWLRTDSTFATIQVRNECCQILQHHSMNGAALLNVLQANSMQVVLSTFASTDICEYILNAIQELRPSDVDGDALLTHWQNLQLSQNEDEEKEDEKEEEKMQSPLSPATTKAIHYDDDDEKYTQRVWKEILQFFDADKNGTISHAEMAPALRALGIDVNEKKLMQVITKMDRDQSGTIDYVEFRQYYHKLFRQRLDEGLDWAYIQRTFAAYDADQSGCLDRNEFEYALRKICANIEPQEMQQIWQVMDRSGDGRVDLDEFVHFLSSDHEKAYWLLKKMIRGSIPTPLQYLRTFQALPTHFRESQLWQTAQRNSFKISDRLQTVISADGMRVANISMHPQTQRIEPNINHSSRVSERSSHVRVFKVLEASGIALPAAAIAERIVHRFVCVCLYVNGKAASNVVSIPVDWRSNEEDQWRFGGEVWRESPLRTVAEWNQFCVVIEPDSSGSSSSSSNCSVELMVELCVTLKRDSAPTVAQAPVYKPPLSPQRMMPQPAVVVDNAGDSSSTCTVSCGWSKVSIDLQNARFTNSHSETHKLSVFGGTFACESDIEKENIRNDHKNLSFRKIRQSLLGIESFLKIQEQSSHYLSATKKEELRWLSPNVLTVTSTMSVYKMYYELMADFWLRERPIFEFQFSKQNLCSSLLLYVVDRPNLLCVLMEQWTIKLETYWRTQKKNTSFVRNEFKTLLKQFIPLLIHQKIVKEPLLALNEERIQFVTQMVKGNVKQILNGNKPASSIPLVFTPFSTDLFLA